MHKTSNKLDCLKRSQSLPTIKIWARKKKDKPKTKILHLSQWPVSTPNQKSTWLSNRSQSLLLYWTRFFIFRNLIRTSPAKKSRITLQLWLIAYSLWTWLDNFTCLASWTSFENLSSQGGLMCAWTSSRSFILHLWDRIMLWKCFTLSDASESVTGWILVAKKATAWELLWKDSSNWFLKFSICSLSSPSFTASLPTLLSESTKIKCGNVSITMLRKQS